MSISIYVYNTLKNAYKDLRITHTHTFTCNIRFCVIMRQREENNFEGHIYTLSHTHTYFAYRKCVHRCLKYLTAWDDAF